MRKTDIEKLAKMDMAEWRNFFDNIDEMAKRKTVTEKFETIKPALELCREFAEENDGEVSIEYGITGVSFIVESLLFDVSFFDMPKYRKFINMIDSISITPLINGNVRIVFEIKDVFQLPHSKRSKPNPEPPQEP